jgi:hypothetical protein
MRKFFQWSTKQNSHDYEQQKGSAVFHSERRCTASEEEDTIASRSYGLDNRSGGLSLVRKPSCSPNAVQIPLVATKVTVSLYRTSSLEQPHIEADFSLQKSLSSQVDS